MNKVLRIGVSILVSVGIVWLILHTAGTSAGEVMLGLTQMAVGIWVVYTVAQVLQTLLRAIRYRLLLAGSGVTRLPSRGRMFGVTLARNMFVDMLPARAGELSYWALLNQGEGVRHEDCISSMAVGLWFDIVALALIVVGLIGLPLSQAAGLSLGAPAVIVMVVILLVGGGVIFYGPALADRMLRALPTRIQQWRWMVHGERFLRHLADSLERVRHAGVLGRVTLLSVGVRVVKYLGLVVLFRGAAQMLRPELAKLPFWQMLMGLIGGEAGAALPVPTVLSFGAYEGSGASTMSWAGVPAADAGVVLLGTHIASQIVDYLLGGLGLLGLLWSRGAKQRGAPPSDSRAGRTNPFLLMWAFFICLAIAVLGGWAWKVRADTRAGLGDPPTKGELTSMGPHEIAALEHVWGDSCGFVVWSSIMYGQHDLVRFDWPSGKLTRLTSSPFTDSTPKISPTGKQVVFARSRQEWVSFRNLEEWDIWVLDLQTHKEKLVAERGAEPCWTGDGKSVVFHRGGKQVVQVEVDTGKETILLDERPGVIWTGPVIDPAGGRLAVTVRGRRRYTALVNLADGNVTQVGGGCQLSFVPGGAWLVLVESAGNMGTRFARVSLDGKTITPIFDSPGYWSHEYFPRISNDGRLLVYGAAREGHEHDRADYEIFLWRLDDPPEKAARLSFHSGNDQWPDIWVLPPPQKKASASRK